ncbi:SCO family protein [Bacillus aquiflavi]|uniref:SCO family protein n=1 Tax=Bacillus aquiflavi TaxID=2672567 RepID=A0A6B3VXL4_9BACI|nr:SCO family protein [Bacillus aquiflavi]MBA4537772.1 SCO family protein [Bacillus aquiflavi]NEY82028.1 SCO family protein [Bacillus aquiflavi]
MKFRLLTVLTLMTVLFLSACGKNTIPDAKNYPIESFSHTDHNGESFGLSDLKGKVWVADFIFTNCDDVCLPMTSNMAKLQQMLKEEGIKDVELVSFSVDPQVDSPEVLTQFGKQFNADFSNWHFLTGYTQEYIENFAKDNFKTIVKKPQKGDQVIHGTDFYLVDQEGTMVKYYTGLKDIPFEEIISHIKILQEK